MPPRKVRGHEVYLDVTEEITCSVCFLLLVQPTTLTCGHTLCRTCLAKWYFMSQKKGCPFCNQLYQGHPMINTSIKNMIIKFFPVQLKNREKELAKDQDIVRKYDEELMKETARNTGDCASFCAGVTFIICGFLIAYLAWYWQYSQTNLTEPLLKPVQFWKTQDVVLWLEDMPWASTYANMIKEHNIDGNLLLSMDEESLTLFLNVSDTAHRRALVFAVNKVQHEGVKVPSSL